MKKVLFVAFASLSFLSAGAVAGENCLYGKNKNLVMAAVEESKNIEKVDPTLLALLKKQQSEQERVQQIITFN